MARTTATKSRAGARKQDAAKPENVLSDEDLLDCYRDMLLVR